MVEPLRHRQTKGAATDMFYLTPPRHISTLPKPEKLNASKCFPLCPESGHRAMQSACPFCANFGSDPISFDHLIGAALGARAPDALHIGSGVLVIPATPPAAVRRSSFPVAARATANRETNGSNCPNACRRS